MITVGSEGEVPAELRVAGVGTPTPGSEYRPRPRDRGPFEEPFMRVFVTGGTGLVGSLLVKKLRERGDQVVALSRRPDAAKQLWGDAVTAIVGDPVQPGPWMEAVSDCDAVVHLAGEGIFNRRWSQEFKDLIYSSRIKSTDNIVAALRKAPAAGAPGSPASSSLAP